MHLGHHLIYPVGTTKACQYASDFLTKRGFFITDHPTPEVTHLLMDIPSFAADGTLRGGGTLESILERLPQSITVIGGNLNQACLTEYKLIDLLMQDDYLAKNAAITADCALQVAANKMATIFADSPALVIGWGRIGKCLAQMLRGLGTDITVAARSGKDRSILKALGYRTISMQEIPTQLKNMRLLFNTAPEPVLSEAHLRLCRDCLKIDLASRPGLEGSDVIYARGLPGIYAPASSGKLIAETIMPYIEEEIQ